MIMWSFFSPRSANTLNSDGPTGWWSYPAKLPPTSIAFGLSYNGKKVQTVSDYVEMGRDRIVRTTCLAS